MKPRMIIAISGQPPPPASKAPKTAQPCSLSWVGAKRTIDSLQNNSILLQRNSNITAIEFQQFQWVCVSELFCSGRISPDFAGFRRK
jgi:hypothetical protein